MGAREPWWRPAIRAIGWSFYCGVYLWLFYHDHGFEMSLPVRVLYPGGLIATIVCYWLQTLPRMRRVAEADEKGVTKRTLWRVRTVPWHRVAAYRFEGDYCIVCGSDGETLLTLHLDTVPEAERDRFLAFIEEQRTSHAPAELMAASAPEGTGLEPEAAVAPAGRGTEPLAAGAELEPLAAAVPAGAELEPLAAAPEGVGLEPASSPERDLRSVAGRTARR